MKSVFSFSLTRFLKASCLEITKHDPWVFINGMALGWDLLTRGKTNAFWADVPGE